MDYIFIIITNTDSLFISIIIVWNVVIRNKYINEDKSD